MRPIRPAPSNPIRIASSRRAHIRARRIDPATKLPFHRWKRGQETMDAAQARLDGKVAVVTGGTQGLGEATARLFAARGARGIMICGRNAGHGKAVTADLANLDQARAVMAAADSVFGRVDILVNAAGMTDRGTVFDTSPELFERMMA